MEYISNNTAETEKIAQELADKVLADFSDKKSALVIALEGELGAGKTTFTQAFGQALGIEQTMTSPTFVIMKSYLIAEPHNEHFKTLTHIDCYRLNGAEDMLPLGFVEMISDPANILLIEWPERIAEILPADKITIHIDHIDESTRKIRVNIEEKVF